MAPDSPQGTVSELSMATGMGETLHRSPRNAESFRIKRRAFRLVPPDGGLLVSVQHRQVTRSSVQAVCSKKSFGDKKTVLQSTSCEGMERTAGKCVGSRIYQCIQEQSGQVESGALKAVSYKPDINK